MTASEWAFSLVSGSVILCTILAAVAIAEFAIALANWEFIKKYRDKRTREEIDLIINSGSEFHWFVYKASLWAFEKLDERKTTRQKRSE